MNPFLNRELSWLEFDRRVLALAEDADRPLLERVKFLAIFSRNLDEFFQVRVSGLQDAVALGHDVESPDGRSAAEELVLIRERVEELGGHAQAVWRAQLQPALRDAGIEIVSWSDLDGEERFRGVGHRRASLRRAIQAPAGGSRYRVMAMIR